VKQCIFFLLYVLSTTSLFSKEIFSSFSEYEEKKSLYRSVTERYKDYHGKETIENSLRASSVSLVNKNLFDRIAHHEEIGCIGYHGSTQSFRVYQDSIRFVLEEIVGLSIPDAFHFFRIPLSPYYVYEDISQVPPGSQWDPSLFLWLNYAIYGNYNYLGSCSYYYFTVNGSAKSQNYKAHLKPLFERLEIDPVHIDTLFSIAMKHIGEKEGVIFQLFDVSGHMPHLQHYALADSHCLTLTGKKLSQEFLGVDAAGFYGEIRLLLHNTTTLNPYSYLRVNRFDRLSSDETQAYEKEMRACIRKMPFSEEKQKRYKEELIHAWSMS